MGMGGALGGEPRRLSNGSSARAPAPTAGAAWAAAPRATGPPPARSTSAGSDRRPPDHGDGETRRWRGHTSGPARCAAPARPCPASPAPPPAPHRAGGGAPRASGGAAAADPPTPTPWEPRRTTNRPSPPHRRTRPAGGPAPGPANRPAVTRRGAPFAGGGRLAEPWREGRSMGRAGGRYLGGDEGKRRAQGVGIPLRGAFFRTPAA